ncbi:MAG: hypothetical protein KKE62_06345 [Proteobacteria bacterium]|nr:hypothetical protein [Pseudomonadota bacterium]MBU1542449.1 hypothetical protein [Pseudomonadota bacterium]MBU2431106.1 hypothetical protein [Pseudomonadota bacterium]
MSNIASKTNICEFCGKSYSKTCSDEAYIENNCFDCSFWMEKIEMSAEDENRRVIVNGQHYRIGNDDAGIYRGFGGRKFNILFHDGRVIETNNLWHQGTIPNRFREMLPDNAIFLQPGAIQALMADKADIHFNKGENKNV